MNFFLKILTILSLPLLLNACGGGGGGGSSGAAVSYTVPACSDTGTNFQGNEYYGIGSNSGNRVNQLELICASSAYARGATGDGIKIAVVDTGGPWDASGNISNGEFNSTASDIVKPSNSDYVNSDSVPNDDYKTAGHGTGVACMIRCDRGDGDMHGVAYNSILSFYKIFGNTGTIVSDTNVGAAYNAADSNDIINSSWGTGTNGCSSVSNCEALIGSTTYAAMKTATGTNGKILVWSAGNSGNANPSAEGSAVVYDTDLQGLSVVVVSIDATNADTSFGDEDGRISSFSDRCGIAAAYCIAAPGGDIRFVGRENGQTFYNGTGTSYAAPLVSGGLAIIKQEFSSLTNAQVVSRLFATALDTNEYSQTSIYGHGLMNLNAATTAVAKLQTINGSNLLDDPNTSYNDLVNNSFTSSAAFSNALNSALNGQTMEVYDSFDRANFEVGVSSFFTSGSYTSQNTVENHMARLQPKTMKKVKTKNLYGSFTVETDGNFIESSMFQSTGDFLALGFNQSTNSFENAVDPLSNFFNDSNFGNNYLVNPYFNTGSGQDYFMSFNSNSGFGFDTFTNANGNDLGLAFNLNPLSSSDEGMKNTGDLQIVFGANYEQNKFLNSTSSGAFATGDLSNTNFTGVKYKKNFGDDFTFVGSGFAGYTHIDKAANSYIDSSTPLLTSSFTLGLAKANFIKEDQRIGFFINQPQRVEDGNINLRVPTSSDRDRTVTYSNLNVDLEPDARQINFDIIFNKTITESSNLSANLTHVQNGDHSNSSKNQNFISLFYKKTF
jgi:hypothetical protein